MKTTTTLASFLALAAFLSAQADPLPSWNDTPAKKAIIEFVEGVTKKGSPDFVPKPERIAVFDNDGTLWSEQPMYFQVFYIIDRVKELAPQHPEWKTEEPIASLLKGDIKGVQSTGMEGLMKLVAATHAGMTTEEFTESVSKWISSAKHPKTGKPLTKMIFQPMVELLAYLRANGFRTYIVSGGGIEFMRPWTEKTYGIPPEQVVGSSLKLKYEVKNGKPVLMKLAEIDLVDDHAGKPVGIQSHIGRRPIFAAGNSDGDFEMLEWTTAGDGQRFGLLVHHTDAEREWAYDRESSFGRLAHALDEAPGRGWTVVDMKRDWEEIFVP
jgi:phosphoglycolate phosphatase-like HAD superfamily hydrolase